MGKRAEELAASFAQEYSWKSTILLAALESVLEQYGRECTEAAAKKAEQKVEQRNLDYPVRESIVSAIRKMDLP